jgi:hypothetical protein
MVAPYSIIDLTRVTYVVFRHVSGTFLVKLARPKRNIKANHFKDLITSNIVEKRTCNNTKGLELQVRLQETAVPKFFLCEHRNSLEPSVKQCRACKFLRSI